MIQLRRRLNLLVAALTLTETRSEVDTLVAALADTAAAAEQCVGRVAPAAVAEIRGGLADARSGQFDGTRSALLAASHQLTGLLRDGVASPTLGLRSARSAGRPARDRNPATRRDG
ncbi:hypothetical protein [Prauserella cavernicola]|uniref:Uncharacterized protein n=1 Tax=Prauserella cavernicola TaxID=2800127 RepID=A0A934QP17_9PSEU|nr:hypothetical protein [Prauserella cavernicola]MBK1783512.1 hypothetical protein [Prauserella cavernicola]